MTVEDRDHNALNDGWTRFLPEYFRGAVVPVVRLSGTIGAVTPLRPGLSLSGVSKLLEKAFETKRAKAVALVINSPGGSPVQSHQIYARIRQLAETKKIPVLAFVEDFLRLVLDSRIDRRHRRHVRFSGSHQEDRHRAQDLHFGRAQEQPRSIPAGKPGRRCAAEGDPARDP